MHQCECGSGKDKASCCRQYINGDLSAPDALCLMRSRYTAFHLKNENYLLNTWAEQTRPTLSELNLNSDPAVWIGLQVHDYQLPADSDQFVCFSAFSLQAKQLYLLKETSRFIFQSGMWRYLDGEIHPQSGRVKNPGNQLCPCGVGKKFKKCHGR